MIGSKSPGEFLWLTETWTQVYSTPSPLHPTCSWCNALSFVFFFFFFAFVKQEGRVKLKMGDIMKNAFLPKTQSSFSRCLVSILLFFVFYSFCTDEFHGWKKVGKAKLHPGFDPRINFICKDIFLPPSPTHTHIQCAAGLWTHGGKSILYQINPAFTVELSGCSCYPSEPLNTN